MQQLILVRHAHCGDTDRYHGQGPIDLDSLGQRQAEALGSWLPPWRVTSSHLRRARQTATHLAGPLDLDERLAEVDFGEWEGLTFAEIQQKWPDHIEPWAKLADDFSFPGGESLCAFNARIDEVAVELKGLSEDRILVSHGGVLRHLLCRLLSLPLDGFQAFALNHAGVSVFEFNYGHFRLKNLNNCQHLNQVPWALS